MTDCNRCTGHCCQKFMLPYSPQELKESYLAWKRGGMDIVDMNQQSIYTNRKGAVAEIYLIYPMVKYLGPSDRLPQNGQKQPGIVHTYTCKHYDKETGDCTIYDIRPQMCSEYPYNRPCEYEECTWTDKRETAEQKESRVKAYNEAQEWKAKRREKLYEAKEGYEVAEDECKAIEE